MTLIATMNLNKTYSYPGFRKLVDELLAKGKVTSGNDSDFPLAEFTKVNVQRMNRLDATIALQPELMDELKGLSEKWTWVVLAEGWCGDVSQNLPVIAKMADVTENIELKILLRDENPEIMDNYLTNGGRSIPKLICFSSATHREKGTWGPRPEPVQKMVMELKEKQKNNTDSKELVERYHHTMHKWYNQDKSQTIQQEFLKIIKYWKNKY